MAKQIFTEAFTTDPYWWEAAPPPDPGETELPSRVEVAVIGSGYTGLSAALTLARGGREVIILEAGVPGQGASTRNAGNVSRTLKTGFKELQQKYGLKRAAGYYWEAAIAIDYLDNLIHTEQIACHFRRSGRYYAAHSPRAYETLARQVESLRKHVGYEAEMVPRAEQRREVGTDRYYGGQILRGPGYLHAGLYHRGLLDRARAAGARIFGWTRVTRVRGRGGDFTVSTERGDLKARDVVVATNAYTGHDDSIFRYVRRRLIPIDSFVAATELISADRLQRILPGGRPVIDTHKVVFHIQPAPDGTRLIIGGRATRRDGSLRATAGLLHRHFGELFPDFRDIRLSHCWEGRFAFTFDYLPHIGTHEGVHYALGYCGTGVPLGTYLGHKLALRILGAPDAETVFADRPFPTIPFYTGRPWFLPGLVRYYAFRDTLPF